MRWWVGVVLAGLVGAGTVASEPEAGRGLAPEGVLRAAINLGNPVLAQRDPAGGEPHGVSVELARELGRRLGLPVRLVVYGEAGVVADRAPPRGVTAASLGRVELPVRPPGRAS
jgi:polar amino acid transport system substrate-binding protein